MSDYGSSTSRIIYTFTVIALGLGFIYFIADMDNSSRLINALSIESMPWYHSMLRAIYFSVVTMTTLGFGDIYAYPKGYLGHILLIFQVISGYIILGALVTRLGIIFSGVGPAQPVIKPKKYKNLKSSDKDK